MVSGKRSISDYLHFILRTCVRFWNVLFGIVQYDQIPVIHYKTMETETIYYPSTRSECEVAVYYKKVVDFKWTK